ncbi:MAG: hypothetical protein CMJ33_09255 [Phycisphaerae bacterium]|nr:hypothetical protein [Phycisphaerae bacterium]
MKNTTEQAEDGAARNPRPMGLLAYALANLVQGGGDAIQLKAHHPASSVKTLEERLDSVAAAQEQGPALRRTIKGIRGWETALIIIMMVIFSASGGLAAAGSLEVGTSGAVNIFWLLGVVLGIQTILLLIWVVLAIPGGALLRRFSGGSLMISSIGAIARTFTPSGTKNRASRRRCIEAAATAVMHVDFGGHRTRWALSSITHLGWTVFNLGLLIAMLVILSVQRFDFGWETTIGSDAVFKEAGRIVSIAPQKMGFPVPSRETFAAARIDPSVKESVETDSSAAVTRKEFSGLLVGSVLVYGLTPRVILFTICFIMWKRATRRWRPDTGSAGFAPLMRWGAHSAVEVEIVKDEPLAKELDREETGSTLRRASGSAILGLELEPPSCGWPPPCGATIVDLGILSSREDRNACIRRIEVAETAPARLVVVVNLVTTPDNGMFRIVERLHAASDRAMLKMILTGGERFRRRVDSEALEQRISDWRAMIDTPEIEGEAVELDLDHLTAETRAKLAELVTGKGRPELPEDQGRMVTLDAAFAEIAVHARHWHGAPDEKELLVLQRAVASCAGADAEERLMGIPDLTTITADPVAALDQAAKRMQDFLPADLRNSAKWCAVGATVGTLACLVTAGSIAPVVLGALPGWLATGAVSGGVLGLLREDASAEAQDTDAETIASIRGEVIASAAMHAILLSMQGRGERAIQETLERTFLEEPPSLAHTNDVGVQLGIWRTRLSHVLEERGGR